MSTHPILIGGRWTPENDARVFTPENPANAQALGDHYPISPCETLSELAEHGARAAESLNACPPDQIAEFLEAHARLIDERRDEIAAIAHAETGLPLEPRLRSVEMDRTIDQLLQTARCVRQRDWVTARIDTGRDLRSMYEPLGASVLTIGPNNFPLAYNAVAGGDFASAIAARNPVIAKAHPLHPGITRLLARCAHDAINQTGLPESSIQMFYHCTPEDGLDLVRDPGISAVGFTGSRAAGLALKQAADETGTPIYLELSSINPMFMLPGALDERAKEIADMIADSMLAASGQQCTCPGLLVVDDSKHASDFIELLERRLDQAETQVMLSVAGVQHLHECVKRVHDAGAELLTGGHPIEGNGARYAHTLLRTDAQLFIEKQEAMSSEMFGVAALVVIARDHDQFLRVARCLQGNLTGTIHRDENCRDDELSARLTSVLRPRVGRLIHDGVPTGVSVSSATVHGGPYPATGHPGFTAVGMPTSIARFAALRCYDRVRPDTLPAELHNTNPTGTMLRSIDDQWTTADAPSA